MSEIKEKQFVEFFQDKSNISQSSYKIDPKTNLPIVYMRDQKKALWTKFSDIYPNGMKKTSFMVRLANCSNIQYKDNIGGLCQTCNDYGYESFDNLIAIARNTFQNKDILVSICLYLFSKYNFI